MEKSSDDDYLQILRELQTRCADRTWKHAPKLGEKAPILVQALEVLLCILEKSATCFGGCRRGDHRAEFLTGRAVSSCQACLLLMSTGYYDEALSIIRSLGEIANLMAMFVAEKSEFERWKTLDEKARRQTFSPVKVRLWLEKKGATLVVNEQRYRILSAYTVHASPDTLPQAHNQHGNATIGPVYQEAGFLLCLNELARSMAFIGIFSAKLVHVSAELREAASAVSRCLVENIGGITTDVRGRPWFSLT